MKLFAIYIGGEHPNANIEIHDVRFVVAGSIKETHQQLKADWWGTPGTLHVDCWAEIDHVDGYDVTLKPERSLAREKLWFVNLGGYDGRGFAEQHKTCLWSRHRQRRQRRKPCDRSKAGPTRIGMICSRPRKRSRWT